MRINDAQFVGEYLAESLAAVTTFATDKTFGLKLRQVAETITQALRAGNKLLVAGNGGSAADAQHIAAELVSRLMFDRAPLAAIALTTDTSGLTAIGNDYGYDFVFERQVQALGHPGDVLLGISTSGRSANVLRALAIARSLGMITVGFAGARADEMQRLCDLLLSAPSSSTAIIQQIHITAAHTVCALVERAMFPPSVGKAGAGNKMPQFVGTAE